MPCFFWWRNYISIETYLESCEKTEWMKHVFKRKQRLVLNKNRLAAVQTDKSDCVQGRTGLKEQTKDAKY